MNNLLLKNKARKNQPKLNPEADGLLSSLLFDSSILDTIAGVNDNIIEEVNNSIKRN